VRRVSDGSNVVVSKPSAAGTNSAHATTSATATTAAPPSNHLSCRGRVFRRISTGMALSRKCHGPLRDHLGKRPTNIRWLVLLGRPAGPARLAAGDDNQIFLGSCHVVSLLVCGGVGSSQPARSDP
jgi:hypothetical protein